MGGLLPMKEALSRILDGVARTSTETITIAEAGGRVLAQDLQAKRTQPPFAASAMDGYAVRAQDIATIPCTLTLVGESAAGHGYSGSIGAGDCVRIFTGAPLPQGSDTIVIQENVTAKNDRVTINQGADKGRYVRPAGLDFAEGDVLLRQGDMLNSSRLSLAAAMNHAAVPVQKKPVVAVIATGDELRVPGSDPSPDQIIASNTYGVCKIISDAGGEAIDLGIASDTMTSLNDKFDQADDVDIVITLGGASVGDHDLVRQALMDRGVSLDFWKIAMRPGKPLMFGSLETKAKSQRYIGLPGNPVSSLVCALLFVRPLIAAHLGLPTETPRQNAILGDTIAPNDEREEYMRGTCHLEDGTLVATPFSAQDSSMISVIAKANCLIVRPAHAPEMPKGSACSIVLL